MLAIALGAAEVACIVCLVFYYECGVPHQSSRYRELEAEDQPLLDDFEPLYSITIDH